jgi:hypothetical protein
MDTTGAPTLDPQEVALYQDMSNLLWNVKDLSQGLMALSQKLVALEAALPSLSWKIASLKAENMLLRQEKLQPPREPASKGMNSGNLARPLGPYDHEEAIYQTHPCQTPQKQDCSPFVKLSHHGDLTASREEFYSVPNALCANIPAPGGS